jgi:hypothetical protein
MDGQGDRRFALMEKSPSMLKVEKTFVSIDRFGLFEPESTPIASATVRYESPKAISFEGTGKRSSRKAALY